MRPFSDSISLSRGSRTSRKSGCNLAPIHLSVHFSTTACLRAGARHSQGIHRESHRPSLDDSWEKRSQRPIRWAGASGTCCCRTLSDYDRYCSTYVLGGIFGNCVSQRVDLVINGQWLKQAETGKSLELPPSKTGVQSDEERN